MIPVIKSRAQAHLIGGVITGNTTVPGVTPDEARDALRGVAVNSLPDYVDTALSFTPSLPSGGAGINSSGGSGRLLDAAATALTSRHTAPPTQQPTEQPASDGTPRHRYPRPRIQSRIHNLR